MPDLQNFSITPQGAANVNVPRAVISAQLTDEHNGELLNDFTGANAINFPGVLSTLTAQQRASLVQDVAQRIILMRAGIDNG